jgi:hypothetical protein
MARGPWDRIFEIDEEWEELIESSADKRYNEFPPLRTKAWRQARNFRMSKIKKEIEAGIYWKPAELIVDGFLYGRPEWGEEFITKEGDRADEMFLYGRPITLEVKAT